MAVKSQLPDRRRRRRRIEISGTTKTSFEKSPLLNNVKNRQSFSTTPSAVRANEASEAEEPEESLPIEGDSESSESPANFASESITPDFQKSEDASINPESSPNEVARAEDEADPKDGNSSAKSSEENALTEPDEADEDSLYTPGGGQKTKVKATIAGIGGRRRGVFSIIAGTSVVTILMATFVGAPSILITQLSDLLTGKIDRVSLSHQLKYRRKAATRLSDIFSKDGRRGGKVIAEMERKGYRFLFDNGANKNKIKAIVRPDGSGAVGEGIGLEIEQFQERKWPLFRGRWKTNKMDPFYRRYGVIKRSIVTPSTTDLDTPDKTINRNMATAADVEDFDPEARIDPEADSEDLTDEERAARDSNTTLAKNTGAFAELEDFVEKGGNIDEFPDQSLVRSWRESATGAGPSLLDTAKKVANGGSLGGKVFSGLKAIGLSTDIADKVCTINKRLKAAVLAARTYMALSLMRTTFAYISASDGVKKQEAQSDLLREVMKRLIGTDVSGHHFGSSTGFSYAMNGTFSKSRNDITRSNVATNGQLGDPWKSIAKATKIKGCSVWQNPYAQVGIAAGEIVLTVFTGGLFKAGTKLSTEAVKQAAKAAIKRVVTRTFARKLITSIAIDITFDQIMALTQIYAERTLTANILGQEQGALLADILVGGGGVMGLQRGLKAGQVPATPSQFTAARAQFLAEQRENMKTQSVFTRYFDRSNVDSLAFNTSTKIAANMASPLNTFQGISDSVLSGPNVLASSLLGFIGGSAHAQATSEEIAFDVHVTEGDNAGEELAIDPAGNLLPYMPDSIMNIDPEENVRQLTEAGYIDSNGEPAGAFKTHVEVCVDSLDILSRIESTTPSELKPENDCMAELQLTKRFKAYLALQDYYDVTDANLFPEELESADAPEDQVEIGSPTTQIHAAGLNGYAIPCQGQPIEVVRADWDSVNWSGIRDSGVIGTNSAGGPIKAYVREACDGATDVKTIVIVSSIHGSENGGQMVSHEMLFNQNLPTNYRIIAIPEYCSCAGTGVRGNANGVDLNRNNDFRWSSLPQKQTFASGQTYTKGSVAGSEPETQAINAFLTSLGKTDLFVVYHDALNYVAATTEASSTIASKYGTAAGLPIGKNGRVVVPQSGSLDGWYSQETETPSLLIEMSNMQDSATIMRHVNGLQSIINGNIL